jgi:hypothetical protein
MFWEEKIEALKKIFPQEQFQVPFTTWPDIFKKIGEKFIIKDGLQYECTNGLGNLKKEIHIKTIPWQALEKEISNLEIHTNYWVIIVLGNAPTAKHHVYDCQVPSISQLISMAPADFYIVEKKYNWLTYFKVDRDNKQVSLFKSGDSQTPFDNA